MIVRRIVFLKQRGYELTWERTIELDEPAYHDAAFLRLFDSALRPYQVMAADDVRETIMVTLANSVALANRSPVDAETIVALITGELQLTDVFST